MNPGSMEAMCRPVGGYAAWRGPHIDWRGTGLHVLTAAELLEIDQALVHLKGRGQLDFPDITRETFPLRSTAKRLNGVGRALRYGVGFAMLRGLPRDRYDTDDMARIYFGLGAWLGQTMVQSHKGEVLGHVMDHSGLEVSPRAYHAGGHLGMHTDSSDIVGLMCLRAAESGGASRIASAVAIHDHIASTRPDLLRILYRGFYYRRMDLDAQHGTGRLLSPAPVPVFTLRRIDGVVSLNCYFLGGYARRAAAQGDVRLTQMEIEAIEHVEALAASSDFHLDMEFAEGDIQFLNNRLMLHGRTDYKDAAKIEKRRHLLRLWLKVSDWPALPDEQVFHKPDDYARWALRREPYMELPSIYLQSLRRGAGQSV